MTVNHMYTYELIHSPTKCAFFSVRYTLSIAVIHFVERSSIIMLNYLFGQQFKMLSAGPRTLAIKITYY